MGILRALEVNSQSRQILAKAVDGMLRGVYTGFGKVSGEGNIMRSPALITNFDTWSVENIWIISATTNHDTI